MNYYTADEWLNAGNGTITLCGSTKFFDQYMECARQLGFKGWLFYTCASFGHSYHLSKMDERTPEEYEQVKRLHFIKIMRSDAIVVVTDYTGYIGSSTKAEIQYAEKINIPTFWFDGVNFSNGTIIEPVKSLDSDFKYFDNYIKIHDLNLGF